MISESRKMLWAGYVLTALPALLMLFSGVAKLMKPDGVVKGFVHFGFSEGVIVPLGILEITCTILYLVPRTAVLGAILLTGYLGGAVATNLRAGEPYMMPAIVGLVVWGGIYFRDRRVRELIPFMGGSVGS